MTVNWRRELLHSWPLLAPPAGSQISTTPLKISTAGGRIRIGVDSNGARHLLVPMSIGSDEPESDDVEGSLLVGVVSHSFNNRGARYVDVGCFRADLFDLFDGVLTDILGEISENVSQNPGLIAAKVVNRWRNLLELRRQRLLTLVAQMSLFAELHVLNVVAPNEEITTDWWRGPLRESHDLVFPGCAVEVKAVGASAKMIEIHGIRQLNPPAGLQLLLAVATVIESPDGTTLPELIDKVFKRVVDRGAFDRRLAAVGYSHLDRDRFQHRFEIPDLAHLLVAGSVPRIVPESFATGGPPAGVDHLVYTVSLDRLEPFLIRDLHVFSAYARGNL